MPNKKVNTKMNLMRTKSTAKKRVPPNKATNNAEMAKSNVPDERVWKNPNAKSKPTKKVKLFPRPSRGQYQPPLMKMNMRDIKREVDGRVDEIAEAALSIVHNKMVSLEVNFQKDIAKLQQLYHQVHFKPLQNLRSTLLASISNPQQFRPAVENIKEKMRKTSMDVNTISYDRLLRQCHLLVYAAPEMKAKNFAVNFWKNVLLNGEPVIEKMVKKDDELLNYIEDISCDALVFNSTPEDQEYDENGFQICFKFARSNPYFYNRRIVKRYIIDVYPREKLELLQSRKGTKCKSKCPQEGDMLLYAGPRLVEICTTSIDWKNKDKVDLNSTKIHSLLDYLNFNWSEQKNANNKTAETDYLIATYMRDNLVPNAYGIYHKAMNLSASYSMKNRQAGDETQRVVSAGSAPQRNLSPDPSQPCCSKTNKDLQAFQPVFSGNYNTTSLLNFLDTIDGGQHGTTTGLKTWSAAELDARGKKRPSDSHELEGLYPLKSACLEPHASAQDDDKNKMMAVDPYKLSLTKFSIRNWKAPKPSCGVRESSSWESVEEEGEEEEENDNGAVPQVSAGYGSIDSKRKSKKKMLKRTKKNMRKYKRTNMKEKFLRRRCTINRMKAGNRASPLTTCRVTLPNSIDNNVPLIGGADSSLTAAITKLAKMKMKRLLIPKKQFIRGRKFMIKTKSSPSWSSIASSEHTTPKRTTSKVLKGGQSRTAASGCSVRSVASKLRTAKSRMVRKSKSAISPRTYGNLPISVRTKRSESVTEISAVLWKDFLATNCRLSGKDKRLFELEQQVDEGECSPKIQPTNNETTRSRKRKRCDESDWSEVTPMKQCDEEGRQRRGEISTNTNAFRQIRNFIYCSFNSINN